MELTSLVATLNTTVQALRTELVSVQLAADSSGLTTSQAVSHDSIP